jgi:hypothetical protein
MVVDSTHSIKKEVLCSGSNDVDRISEIPNSVNG